MPTTNASRLPEKPDLACERRRAKALLKALRNHESDAIARFRSHHPRFAELTPEALDPADVQLSDAQWIIAREYGFPSWPALKAHIEQVSAQGATSQAAVSVVMLDDDATPMQFVVNLLQEVFEKTADEARQIMLDAHNHGVGVCGVYNRWEDAEAKAAAATNLAREHRHPLKVTSTYGDAALRRVRTQEQFSPDDWVPREQWARETSLARRLEKDLSLARAKAVRFIDDTMLVELIDGRTLCVPLAWIPTLERASPDQRQRYETSDNGRGLYWSELGLEVSVSGLLVGRDGQAPLRSVSSQAGSADGAKDPLAPLNEHTKTARGGIFPCACERHLKSEGHAFPTSVMFTNLTPQNISVFWLDYNGERVAYRTLRSGEGYTQQTYISHPWVIVDSHGACLKIVLPGSTTRTVTIE
jgi:ATP-dependent Clp protease adapter protein ClpS